MANKFKSFPLNSVLSKNADAMLALVVILVVALLIMPIPTFLIDIFICANISFALVILLVALYIPKALSLSSFPTILLITTLFRLGLNVATSRLILLNADAGEVILAFGNTVVGGNLVVGIVIFLLLMLINMLVVAKGSERVAEVAARFTLDAMPGKQMSIDADLRSGSIELALAKEKRFDLNRESQLFGAMDGAMKFVKGDVIASTIIFFINILAGIIIGCTELGMDISEALLTFSILSVGDGLVSIIPGLLMSICAGIIVTRVESGKGEQNLGTEIFEQIKKYPKAFLLAAFFIFLVGQIPGMPPIPFTFIALFCAGYGIFARKNQQNKNLEKNIAATEDFAETDAYSSEKKEEQLFGGVIPICIEVNEDLVPLVNDQSNFIAGLIPLLRESFFLELGMQIPGINVRIANDLPKFGYALLLNEIPIEYGIVDPQECLVSAMPHELLSQGITEVKRGTNPTNGLICAITDIKNKPSLEKSGFMFWDAPSRILLHLAALLRKNAKDFISLHETQVILDEMENRYPALVREVVPKIVTLHKLSDIFRKLLNEGVSIKDTKTILQTLAECGENNHNTALLTEQVRQNLSRYICHRHSQSQNTIYALMISPQVEDIFNSSIEMLSTGSFLAMEPELSKKILQSLKDELSKFSQRPKKPVILASGQIRRFVRKLIENEFFDIAVISFQELHPDFKVQPVGRIVILEQNELYDEEEYENEEYQLAPSL